MKTGGRQKGTPNRDTVDIAARLAKLNCDPIEGMAQIAMDANNRAELRGRMYAELAGYLHPKRKAIEHTVPGADNSIESWLAKLDESEPPAVVRAGRGT